LRLISLRALPPCQQISDRVHSRYHRALADLPCAGRQVYWRVSLRKFYCTNAHRSGKVFSQRLGRSSWGVRWAVSVPGEAAQQALLAERLRSLRHLLILDNLESVTGERLAIQNTLPAGEQAEASYQKALEMHLANRSLDAADLKRRSASIYHQLGRVAQEQ
jgi:hypothetical protein